MPKLSIIVPVYNAQSFLNRCLDSILTQTFNDYELILINDGSKDDSGKICDQYAAENQNIKVFHKENGGVSSARNLALDNTAGEWILFVDSDDCLEPDSLTEVAKYLENPLINLIQFNTTRTDLNFNIQTHTFTSLSQYAGFNYFQPALWNYVFKADIVKTNKLNFTTSLKYAEDLEFVMKYFAHVSNVQTLKVVVYNYTPAETSAMNSIPAMLFVNNNLTSINNVLNYISTKDIAKGFYTYNMYVFLKYTLRSLPKYTFTKEEIGNVKKLYRQTFKKLFSFSNSAAKYLLLDAAYIAFSPTLSLIKIVWR